MSDQDKDFSDGYEHIKEYIDVTKQHLKQIDAQIENMPPDRGPTPRLVPKGAPVIVPPSRNQKISFLNGRKDLLKSDAWNKTEMETRDADSTIRTQVRDQVREELFPNPFRGKSKEELLNHKGDSKDIDVSQDYMDAQRLEFKYRHLASLSFAREEKELKSPLRDRQQLEPDRD